MLGEACADHGVVAGVKRQICARRDRNRSTDQRRVVAWIGARDGEGEERDLGKALADAGCDVGEFMRPHRPARGVDALHDTRAGDALERVLTLAGEEQIGAVAAGLRDAALADMDVSEAGARLDEQGWLGLPAPTEPRQRAGGEAIEAAARTPLDPAAGDPAVAVATLKAAPAMSGPPFSVLLKTGTKLLVLTMPVPADELEFSAALPLSVKL
jgi:hypothetical protein